VAFWKALRRTKETLRLQNSRPIVARLLLFHYQVCLLESARELWWVNQDWLELRRETHNSAVLGTPCATPPCSSKCLTNRVCVTRWSRALPEELIVSQPVTKSHRPTIYRTRRFNTVLTREETRTLFWATTIQCVQYNAVSIRLTLILSSTYDSSPKWYLPFWHPTNILNANNQRTDSYSIHRPTMRQV
jgi:hypothetical protein